MPDDITLTVGAVAHGGHCVARHDGRVIFVRHALPGERVVARLTDASPEARYWRADAVSVLEPSPDRVEHPWPEAGPGGVGGAELGHVALPAQREWKTAVLADAFDRFAHVPFTGAVASLAGDDERGGLRYRTRVSAIADGEGRAGMRGHRSHDIHALAAMPLATEAAEAALLGQRFPAGSRVSVADAGEEPFVTVDGVRWHGGRRDARANAPKRVTEVVRIGDAEHQLVVDATGFWQVHREAPSLLATRVRELAGTGTRALELYSGAGLLTTALAPTHAHVTAVESDADAVRAARRNLAAHPNVTLVQGDVRATLKSGVGLFDAVVLDPPRSGAGRATLVPIAATGAKRLIYVACDPVALARDVATLAELGYALTHVEAWDLFPMTHHVEAIAVFEPA